MNIFSSAPKYREKGRNELAKYAIWNMLERNRDLARRIGISEMQEQDYDFEELEADFLSISGGTDTTEPKQTLDHRDPK